MSNEWVKNQQVQLDQRIWEEYQAVTNPQPVDWDSIFKRRPDLRPPGYEEAVADAMADIAKRYELHGKKRAKGSNTRKQTQVSRKGLQEKERRGRFPSLKHGAD